MAKSYNSYSAVLADAVIGKLEWGDPNSNTGLAGAFWHLQNVSDQQWMTVIRTCQTTEPNQDWVKGGWLQISNDGRSIIYNPSHGPSPNGPAAPGMIPPNLSIPKIGNVNDFLNTLVSPNLWVRVAEFAVGIVLLAVGANALIKQGTGVNPAGGVRKAVKVGSKAALL